MDRFKPPREADLAPNSFILEKKFVTLHDVMVYLNINF